MTDLPVRILIGDSHALFRSCVRRLLESQPDFAVVGEAEDGESLISLARELKPNVLLFEIKMRKRSGLEVLSEISEIEPDIRPIILAGEIEDRDIVKALLLGARGVVRKNSDTSLLFKSIRTVMAGGYWIGRKSVEDLVKNLQHLSKLIEKKNLIQTHSLTPQQLRIVQEIANGCSNKDIAQDLSISERTVKYHLTRIFAKLGVSGRMELARFSITNKISTGT